MRRFPFLIAAMLASPVVTTPAAAHEKGVLRPATRDLSAGDSLGISGEHFAESATLTLQLVGPRGRIGLGAVRTDSGGAFSARLLVPAETVAGAYRLVAIASDGDEVATVDVAVLAARTTEAPRGMAALETMEEPTDTPLALDRARRGSVTIGVAALAAVAAMAGLGLVRHRSAVG